MRDKYELIDRVKKVLDEYAEQQLTVRQIHYRLVAQQWNQYPNLDTSYHWLIVNSGAARLAGEIPWEAIEDRTREVKEADESEWTPEGFFRWKYRVLRDAADFYGMPEWWGQPNKVQVWVEKEALASVFGRITDARAVDLVILRGYASLSLLWEIAKRLRSTEGDGKKIQILYFGDFDPSGEDIDRSAIAHLKEDFHVDFEYKRIALTKEQVRKYKLPPAPSKKGDRRRNGFIEKHGVDWQVELDALDPKELDRLIRTSIDAYWNESAGKARELELEHRRRRIVRFSKDALNPNFELPDEGDEKE